MKYTLAVYYSIPYVSRVAEPTSFYVMRHLAKNLRETHFSERYATPMECRTDRRKRWREPPSANGQARGTDLSSDMQLPG